VGAEKKEVCVGGYNATIGRYSLQRVIFLSVRVSAGQSLMLLPPGQSVSQLIISRSVVESSQTIALLAAIERRRGEGGYIRRQILIV
jgi:hypothetical protein